MYTTSWPSKRCGRLFSRFEFCYPPSYVFEDLDLILYVYNFVFMFFYIPPLANILSGRNQKHLVKWFPVTRCLECSNLCSSGHGEADMKKLRLSPVAGWLVMLIGCSDRNQEFDRWPPKHLAGTVLTLIRWSSSGCARILGLHITRHSMLPLS